MLAELQATSDEDCSEEESDTDSLFGSTAPTIDQLSPSHTSMLAPSVNAPQAAAQRTAPPIPGLFFDPNIRIPHEFALRLAMQTQPYFMMGSGPSNVNQVMFFGRASEKGSGLPPFLDDILPTLSALLKPYLPAHTHALIFPTLVCSSASASRQAILNHYAPGEGITPHVDLLTRFADGILGISLGSGTVMTFRRVGDGSGVNAARDDEHWDLYLPERSILVLTGDARYKWSHGIAGRLEDCVEDGQEMVWLKREERVSITLRWLLPGADVVGSME